MGERVKLTLLPTGHTAKWQISSGTGNLYGVVVGVASVVFIAPDTTPEVIPHTTPKTYDPQKTTITATCDQDGIVSTLELTTIRPSGTVYKLVSYTAAHCNPFPLEIGVMAKIYVTPADVNFEAIKTGEDTCTAKTTGYFVQFDNTPPFVVHPPGSLVGMNGHVEGVGTVIANPDNIEITDWFSKPPLPAILGPTSPFNYTAGTFIWEIPQRYDLNGPQGQFCISTHVGDLSVLGGGAGTPAHAGKLSISKNGFLGSITELNIYNPSTPITPPP